MLLLDRQDGYRVVSREFKDQDAYEAKYTEISTQKAKENKDVATKKALKLVALNE